MPAHGSAGPHLTGGWHRSSTCYFLKVLELQVGKNRLHLDVSVGGDRAVPIETAPAS